MSSVRRDFKEYFAGRSFDARRGDLLTISSQWLMGLGGTIDVILMDEEQYALSRKLCKDTSSMGGVVSTEKSQVSDTNTTTQFRVPKDGSWLVDPLSARGAEWVL